MSEDKRRFPRVQLEWQVANSRWLYEARVRWPNEEVTQVIDMSYRGVAVKSPQNLALKSSHELPINLELSDKRLDILATTVRVGDGIVALNFIEVSDRDILRIKDYLDDKIIGSHLTEIDPQHFAERETFSHWFHGPGETEIYVWVDADDSSKAEKVIVYFAEGSLLWEKNQFEVNPPPSQKEKRVYIQRVCSVLSQVQDSATCVKYFVEKLNEIKVN